MLIKKRIFSSTCKCGLLYMIACLFAFNTGCQNASQSDAGSNKKNDTSSAAGLQGGPGRDTVSSIQFTAVKTVQIVLPKDPSPILKNIAALFTRQVQQRCKARVGEDVIAPLKVELAIQAGTGAEGFRIADGDAGTIRITGSDERGILYGVGKFLRTSGYDKAGFTAGTWRGTSVPQKPVRGIYFATHFHNFYHVAPVAEVQRYVEDVALWGYNVLLVWYDMHHFNGFDDPAAVSFRARLHVIVKAAHDIGLDVAWGDVANAGYANSPAKLRAVRCIGKGAQFECDICPSAPGGAEYILANSAKLLQEFSDVRPKYYFIWPYDNGGCNSENCRPWATNGYIRIATLLAAQMRKYIPKAKLILSTWQFSADERRGFEELLSNQSRSLANYLMSSADSVFGSPGGIPLLSFPEITMLGWEPWGGYGAAPLPKRFEKEWQAKSNALSGGFPYSEGLYDDIDKALYAQFYWQPDRPAADIIKEYIDFEFSPDVVEEISRVIAILEHNHKRQKIDSSAEEAFHLVQQAEKKLSPEAKQAWRWRIIFLRAFIDSTIYATVPHPVFKQQGARGSFQSGVPHGEALNAAFKELRAIYHAEKIDQKNVDEVWLLPPQVLTGQQ